MAVALLTPVAATTRREFLRGVSAVALAAFLGACGDDEGSADSGSPVSSAAFPTTITHKYGSTTITAEPKRVVSVGYHEQDWLYAFGVAPLAVREWLDGGYGYATWPWAEEARSEAEAEPVVLDEVELDLETVAALEPDLIIATFSGITEDEYNLLSKIAPTIPQSGDYVDWGMPWRVETRMIAAALGKVEAGEQLITETEARFTKVKAEHPEFEGATCVTAFLDAGAFSTYSSADTGHRLLAEIGFVVPAEIDALADGIYVNISNERVDLLDLDVVIWWGVPPEELEASPLYQQMRLASEGRSVFFVDPLLDGALSMQSPLSFQYVLDHLVPRLAAAIDGDPTTTYEG